MASSFAQTVYIPGGAGGIGSSANANFGIGTASPDEKLSVAGNISLGGGYLALREAIGGTAYSVLQTVSNNFSLRVYGSNGWLDAVRIDGDSGRIGLNVTNPGQPLHVWGLNGLPNTSGTSVDGVARFGSGATNLVLDIGISGGGDTVAWIQSRSQIAYGENYHLALNPNGGRVGIGTTAPSHKLTVNGALRAKEVIVDTGWADYVFADDYRLAPLSEVEAHIREKRHLPGIPSAAQVAEQGVSMGEMQARLLAKIEELTLHVIRQQKQLDTYATQLAQLQQAQRNQPRH